MINKIPDIYCEEDEIDVFCSIYRKWIKKNNQIPSIYCEEDRKDFCYPKEQNEKASDMRKCSRPSCDHDEDRIDGYCSMYCRDVHELEEENEKLVRKMTQLLEAAKDTLTWLLRDEQSHKSSKRTWYSMISAEEIDRLLDLIYRLKTTIAGCQEILKHTIRMYDDEQDVVQ